MLRKKQKFENIFTEYYPALCAYAYKFLGSWSEAQDVVSQFFCEALEKGYLDKVSSSLSAYLFTSIRNRSLKQLKHNAQFQKKEGVEFEHTYEFEAHSKLEEDAFQKDAFDKIKTCIQQLPPQGRLIFEMSRFENKTYKEIAAELEIAIGTVETQMSRALKKLRSLYFEN